MCPAQQRHQHRETVKRAVADTRRETLPARGVQRQCRNRMKKPPEQPQRHQQRQRIADIGVDRAIEEAIGTCRNMVHPPAIGDHADDGEAETPVQCAGYSTPRGIMIVNRHKASCKCELVADIQERRVQTLQASWSGWDYFWSKPCLRNRCEQDTTMHFVISSSPDLQSRVP